MSIPCGRETEEECRAPDEGYMEHSYNFERFFSVPRQGLGMQEEMQEEMPVRYMSHALPASVQDDYLKIALKQNFSGKWQLSDIAEVLQLKTEDLVSKKPKEVPTDNIWATIIALAVFFHKNTAVPEYLQPLSHFVFNVVKNQISAIER